MDGKSSKIEGRAQYVGFLYEDESIDLWPSSQCTNPLISGVKHMTPVVVHLSGQSSSISRLMLFPNLAYN